MIWTSISRRLLNNYNKSNKLQCTVLRDGSLNWNEEKICFILTTELTTIVYSIRLEKQYSFCWPKVPSLFLCEKVWLFDMIWYQVVVYKFAHIVFHQGVLSEKVVIMTSLTGDVMTDQIHYCFIILMFDNNT